MVNELLEKMFETVHYDETGDWRKEPLTEEDPDEISPSEKEEQLIAMLLSKALGEDIKLSTKAIICDADGRFLILRDSTPGSKFWDLPGGHVADGETQHEGLVRELKQETGIDLVSEPEELFTRELTLGKETKPVVFYYLELDSSAPNVKLSNEHTDFKWVDNFERKSYNLGVFHDILDRVFEEEIKKARPGLVPKKVKVEREGKQFQAIRWIRPESLEIKSRIYDKKVEQHFWSSAKFTERKKRDDALAVFRKVSSYLPYSHAQLVDKIDVTSGTGVEGASFVTDGRLVLDKISEEVLLHEIGHFVWWLVLSDKERSLIHSDFMDLRKGNAGFPTKYSMESEQEFFAECYRFSLLKPEQMQKRNSEMFSRIKKTLK